MHLASSGIFISFSIQLFLLFKVTMKRQMNSILCVM